MHSRHIYLNKIHVSCLNCI